MVFPNTTSGRDADEDVISWYTVMYLVSPRSSPGARFVSLTARNGGGGHFERPSTGRADVIDDVTGMRSVTQDRVAESTKEP